MKVNIASINSAGIRARMARDHYTVAELLGTYTHPTQSGNDWTVRLYHAADAVVFDTNADPVWEGTEAFDQIASEYGVNIDAITAAMGGAL